MIRPARLALALATLLPAPAPALAADAVTLVLNWVPGAEHAPFFYAQRRGWFRDAGIELTIDSVAGSPEAIKRAVKEPRALAVADFVAFLRTRDAGTPAYAVMALQPRSPYAVYYAEGVAGPKDLAGKRIAAMEQDPMRGLWTALATRNCIDGSQTRWAALSNPQKPDALAAGEVDAALNPFLHNHLNYQAALGERMRVTWWHELGFEAYGHVLVASKPLLRIDPGLVRRLVSVTQSAWAQCLAEPAPCLDALIAEHPQLDREREAAVWSLTLALRDADANIGPVLGGFDPARVRRTFLDLRPGASAQEAAAAERWVTNFLVLPSQHGGSQPIPELEP
jgi:NitT/TauT family transport system substrate-binding protein